MILKDGDIYENISTGLKFTLKQETPITWSLDMGNKYKDYPVYPEKHIISLLDRNYKKVENNE